MGRFSLTSDRAGFAWLDLVVASLVLLPWYKGLSLAAGPAASALAEALAGRGWLWPLIDATLGLSVAALTRGWQRSSLALSLTLGAFALLIWQGFAVGLRGPAADWTASVFPRAVEGQTGLGWGGFLAGIALTGLLSDLFASRGFCRGERFPAFCITAIVALLTLFVFFPILRLGIAAFVDPEGALALGTFWARLSAPDLWGIACFMGAGRCGVVTNTVVPGVLSASFATALGLALALLVNRTDFRMKRALRAISIRPIITPPFVVGVAIILLFGRTSLVTGFVADLMEVRPTRWVYGLPGILIAQVLAFAPVTFLLLLSTLEAINPTLEEASRTLARGR